MGKSKLEDLMCFKKCNSFFNFMGEKNRIFRRNPRSENIFGLSLMIRKFDV